MARSYKMNRRNTNMSIGLVGKKCGMSRVFTEDGRSVPVTVIEATPNRVTQVKTADGDGYTAVQVTTGTKRASLLVKPAKGHFAKAKVEPGRGLWEFRLDSKEAAKYAVGAEIKVDDVFKAGQIVDVAGVTKGKGFQGTIKRHHFAMGDATHGNARSHRAPGSIGQRQTPGRVFPGKKMAGHLGNVRRSAMNLEVVSVDAERHLIAIKGAVPGATGGDVIVRPAAKA
jgi:large subunit ribosomal protein L3